MDPDTAVEVNEHLGAAFDHLREAIMLALAGQPTQEVSKGALGRLERFVESGGDPSVLLEGLPADAQKFAADATLLFDDEPFVAPDEPVIDPDQDNQGPPVMEAPDREPDMVFEGEEDDEFDGLFDDIDEEIEDEPGDAPAAF